MKKLFKSFLVSGLSIAAASALFVGVGSTKEELEVNAYSSNTVTIYVEAFEGYDSNEMYMSYKDSGNQNETIIKKSQSLGSHKYTFEVPEDISQFQVFRGKDSSSEGYDSTNGGCNWSNGWNYTGYITYDSSKNYCKITDWNASYNYYGVYVNRLNAGESLYLTFDNCDYDWFSAGASTSVFTWNDIASTSKVLQCTRLYNSNTVVCTLDEDFDSNGFLAVRVASGKTFDGSDWSTNVVWNQSNNITFTSENAACRCAIIRTVTGQYAAVDGLENNTSSYFAKAFSFYFLEATSDYCNSGVASDLQTSLRGVFDNFESLSAGVKSDFYSQTPSHTKDGWRQDGKRTNVTKEALSRYWNMVKEEEVNDFLGIESNLLSKIAYYSTSNDNYMNTTVIVLIVVTSILTLGGVFLLRRKEN